MSRLEPPLLLLFRWPVWACVGCRGPLLAYVGYRGPVLAFVGCRWARDVDTSQASLPPGIPLSLHRAPNSGIETRLRSTRAQVV